MWRKQRGSTKSDSAGGHRGHPFTPPLPEPEEEGTPPPSRAGTLAGPSSWEGLWRECGAQTLRTLRKD